MANAFTRWLEKGDKRNLALMGAGTAALLAGQKIPALVAFGAGFYGLELVYRRRNDFDGTWEERWERALAFYAETHTHETNRLFHKLGIPVIVGSTIGLVVATPFSPTWLASFAGFVGGWGSNFIGHAIEGSAPALTADPLSFLAGPVSDWKWMTEKEAPANDDVEFRDAAE